MSSVALQFDGIWKKFRKGEKFDSLRDLVPATVKGLFSTESSRRVENTGVLGAQRRVVQNQAGRSRWHYRSKNGIGKDRQITLKREIRFPHSLGLLYSDAGACEFRAVVVKTIRIITREGGSSNWKDLCELHGSMVRNPNSRNFLR
jgi:hypothetical protein